MAENVLPTNTPPHSSGKGLVNYWPWSLLFIAPPGQEGGFGQFVVRGIYWEAWPIFPSICHLTGMLEFTRTQGSHAMAAIRVVKPASFMGHFSWSVGIFMGVYGCLSLQRAAG